MKHGQYSSIPAGPWRDLLDSLDSCWPVTRWGSVGVVVGCSGGADSVGLLRALCALREQSDSARGFVIAAHFDHGIRGAESTADAAFVEEIAVELGIRCVTERANGLATDESTMRDARSAFLRRTAQDAGARYVALAQSLDDNAETVLHNLMRGTGPKGLAGIPITRSMGEDTLGRDLVVIRPLLGVRRSLIRDALRSINQPWREDSSNQDDTYQRNWIRREVLPLMETRFPAVIQAIARATQVQSEWATIIDSFTEDWIDQKVKAASGLPIRIECDEMSPSAVLVASLQKVWARAGWPLRDMSHDHWKRLAGTVASRDDQRYSLPGDIDVVSYAGDVYLSRR